MIRIIFLFFLIAAFINTSFCQTIDKKEQFIKDSLTAITKRVEKFILNGRYMEGKAISTTNTLKDWEGVIVTLYEYKDGKGNPARVYLADADAKKIATWVITTCVKITGRLDYKHSKYLISEINNASNGHFPVLGVVFEDGFPYLFKDGVTVKLTNPIADYLNLAPINDANINKTMKYGRIISTTREEYNLLFPAVNTTAHNWRTVVRNEYKKALNSDENNLIIAWAKRRLK